MEYWLNYKSHKPDLQGKRNKYDNNIYTFDIETTSYLILNGKMIPAIDYLNLNKKEQESCIFQSNMYIWMFGINNKIYYGRTWEELKQFFIKIDFWTDECKKYVYVHNLPFEFQFLRNEFKFKKLFARKSRKPIMFDLVDYHFSFRCSYSMSNCSLEKLADVYKLPIKKLSGNLDYYKIRNSKTKLSEKELAYCENDCLVVYEYIKKELSEYGTLKNIPLTSTGHVRKELKEKIERNYKYKWKVKRAINTNPHVFNLLQDAFQGGYTHANWIYADEIIKDVTSYDFASSYPFVMLTEKYPASEFKKCNIKKIEQVLPCFAYLIRIKFNNLKCKYYNNFISFSKCKDILNGKYDNGRVISADQLEIVLTDIDLKFIFNTYEFDSYEFIEVYWSKYDYLPIDFMDFILEKYVKKTELKNVKGKELEYMLEKNKFNSLYGMSVTNNIRDNVIYDDKDGWQEIKLTNTEIIDLLFKEKDYPFLSFSYGVWVTAYARNNLLNNLIEHDEFVIYSDTDSLKLKSGFDKKLIENYNNKVIEKIKNVSNELKIDFDKYCPQDIKGKKHLIGLFEEDGKYDKFITQGAKKYAYIDSEDNEIHITVSGVPKKGANALKNIEDFRDNFIFKYEDTGKLMMMYNDEQTFFNLLDYQGNNEVIRDKYGCCFVPTTYELGKAQEYFELITDESSTRARFKER